MRPVFYAKTQSGLSRGGTSYIILLDGPVTGLVVAVWLPRMGIYHQPSRIDVSGCNILTKTTNAGTCSRTMRRCKEESVVLEYEHV